MKPLKACHNLTNLWFDELICHRCIKATFLLISINIQYISTRPSNIINANYCYGFTGKTEIKYINNKTYIAKYSKIIEISLFLAPRKSFVISLHQRKQLCHFYSKMEYWRMKLNVQDHLLTIHGSFLVGTTWRWREQKTAVITMIDCSEMGWWVHVIARHWMGSNPFQCMSCTWLTTQPVEQCSSAVTFVTVKLLQFPLPMML